MPEAQDTSLDEQQAQLTAEYLELRQTAATDSKAKRKLSRLGGKIDGLYWKRVAELVNSRVVLDQDSLAFSDEERLLIDFGLLDPSLVENAPENLPEKLIEEIRIAGPVNHFYLSEWLEHRYRGYRLTESMTAAAAKEDKTKARSKWDLERARIMSHLSPLFQGLPGVGQELAGQVAKGELDQQILLTSITLLRNSQRKLFLYRSRLRSLRGQVLEKARARAGNAATLKLFDALEDTYAYDWRDRFKTFEGKEAPAPAESAAAPDAPSGDKASEFLSSELAFVKTLLPLGALAGGVGRTCAVLLKDSPRVTKADTAAGLARVQDCDWGYNSNPLVLIAPFRGRGIFEWDRDSLVVSLVPVESAEESVANAAGNLRMLTDSLQHDGELRRVYEERFPGVNFQQAFQADYRLWVTQVSRGKTAAMPEDRRSLFRELVGPDCSAVLAPANLRNLGPQALAKMRKRLEKQIAIANPDANLHHRLAVIHWNEKKLDQALEEMAKAARLAPQTGEILFSLGLLLRAQGKPERALAVFEACAARVPDTIWGVYSLDAVAGKI